MTPRSTALEMPEEVTGYGADMWRNQAPIMWRRGHLDTEGRKALTQACQDQVRCIEGPEDAVARCRLWDFFKNYGFTPLARAEMEERGGTVGTQKTDPDAPDDDPAATEEFRAELQRDTFMKIHAGGAE